MNDQSNHLRNLRGLLNSASPMRPYRLMKWNRLVRICQKDGHRAMSFGLISWEAHTTLAIAMNEPFGAEIQHRRRRRGTQRYEPLDNGDFARSAIGKQVCFRPFWRHHRIWVNADAIQIEDGPRAPNLARGAVAWPQGQRLDCPGRHSTPASG